MSALVKPILPGTSSLTPVQPVASSLTSLPGSSKTTSVTKQDKDSIRLREQNFVSAKLSASLNASSNSFHNTANTKDKILPASPNKLSDYSTNSFTPPKTQNIKSSITTNSSRTRKLSDTEISKLIESDTTNNSAVIKSPKPGLNPINTKPVVSPIKFDISPNTNAHRLKTNVNFLLKKKPNMSEIKLFKSSETKIQDLTKENTQMNQINDKEEIAIMNVVAVIDSACYQR